MTIVESIRDAVAKLTATQPDVADEVALRAELATVETCVRQLEARRVQIVAALQRCAAVRAVEAHPGDHRAADRAARDTSDQLAGQLGLSPGQVASAGRTGRELASAPRLRAAFSAGDITIRHLEAALRTLRHLEGDTRAQVEERLVTAAREQDPVTFGRTCRRVLAEVAYDDAVADANARHRRRGLRLADTPDGMLAIHGQVTGLDAETVRSAIQAFRVPDGPRDEPRAPEQATADAFVTVCRAALDSGDAPTNHGIRPHVTIAIDAEALTRRRGVAEGQWTGPLLMEELAGVLPDCSLTRVIRQARSLPLEVSEASHNVPTGIWKALVLRDRGCRWPGCSAPPSWCDGAHAGTPWREHHRWTVTDTLLLCRRHHRRVDLERWEVVLDAEATATFRPPDGGAELTSRAPP